MQGELGPQSRLGHCALSRHSALTLTVISATLRVRTPTPKFFSCLPVLRLGSRQGELGERARAKGRTREPAAAVGGGRRARHASPERLGLAKLGTRRRLSQDSHAAAAVAAPCAASWSLGASSGSRGTRALKTLMQVGR